MEADFSERLRAEREAKELSQTQLAERTGLQPSAISHFETGRRSPSFDNLKRIADALNVSVDYLLGREAQPKSVGPKAQQLFQHYEQMSQRDQELVEDFVAMLKKKDKGKAHDRGS